MDESTTLEALLDLNLHECEEEVKNIVDKGQLPETQEYKYKISLPNILYQSFFSACFMFVRGRNKPCFLSLCPFPNV
jgi:hypothetical protein